MSVAVPRPVDLGLEPEPDGRHRRRRRDCDREAAITRSLLGYLVLAGPFYVVVSLAQALTRNGFDLVHHEWSLLAVGAHGWMQSANLVVTGVMVVLGAHGLRRTRTSRWAPRLLGGYGAGLIVSGLFAADAAHGFPAGTPDGPPSNPTLHGALHLLGGSVGFVCLIAAALVLAAGWARQGEAAPARIARIVAGLFVSSFAGIATGGGSAVINLAFTVAVLLSWAWLTAVGVRLFRGVQDGGARPALEAPSTDVGPRSSSWAS